MIHLENIADLLAATKNGKVYVTTLVRSNDNFLHLLLSVIDNDNNPNILAISFGNNRTLLANLADAEIRRKLSEKGYKVISGRVGSGIEINVSFWHIFNDNGDLMIDILPYKKIETVLNTDTYNGTKIELKEISVDNIDEIKKDLQEMAEKEGDIKEIIPEKRKRNTKETKQ